MAVRVRIKDAKEKYTAWIYSVLGSTTLHLQHEGSLWISLSILTVSSLQALYRNSFGCRGDVIFVLLASVWLSRHMILRFVYTADVSTTRSPTLMGVIAHWLTSVTVAGQYFDRSDVQVVAKNVGIAHVEDVLNPTSPFSLPSLSYTMQFFRALLLDPFLRLLGHPQFLRAPLSFLSSFKESLWHPSFQRLAYYGPPLQLVLTSGVFALYLFYFQEKSPLKRAESHAISMQPNLYQDGFTTASHGGIDPKGAYDPLSPPSWTRVMFFMSCGGTMLSVWLYGRISFPIPDLVAGTNVLKALRNEAKGTNGVSSCCDIFWSHVRGEKLIGATPCCKENPKSSCPKRPTRRSLGRRIQVYCCRESLSSGLHSWFAANYRCFILLCHSPTYSLCLPSNWPLSIESSSPRAVQDSLPTRRIRTTS